MLYGRRQKDFANVLSGLPPGHLWQPVRTVANMVGNLTCLILPSLSFWHWFRKVLLVFVPIAKALSSNSISSILSCADSWLKNSQPSEKKTCVYECWNAKVQDSIFLAKLISHSKGTFLYFNFHNIALCWPGATLWPTCPTCSSSNIIRLSNIIKSY